jgi:CopG family nickel-responsive transcriptional regulator
MMSKVCFEKRGRALMREHIMEVTLVQGQAARLRQIADERLICRGLSSGKLQLSAAILPPAHPLPERQVQEPEMSI